jgi:hypothetical protein
MFLGDGVIIQDVRGAGKGRGFVTLGERDATLDYLTSIDLLGMARRCLRIVGICLRSRNVSVWDLVDEVPSALQEEVVREKAEEYGYEEKESY